MRYRGETIAVERGSIREFFGDDGTLVGCWSLNGNAQDMSRNENHGTVTGAIPYIGRFNNSYRFNGTSDVITCGTNPSLEVQSHTISMWIYFNSFYGTAVRSILSKCDSILVSGFEWATNSSGAISFAFRTSAGIQGWYYTTEVLTLYNWLHLVLVYDSSITKMYAYINGLRTAVVGVAAGTIIYNNDTFLLGFQQLNNYFSGMQENVGIWNRVLSLSEILQYYKWATATQRKKYFYSPEIVVPPTGQPAIKRFGGVPHTNLNQNKGIMRW